MACSHRHRALLVCALSWCAACADTASEPAVARQRSALCNTTDDCAPGLFCVLNLCCSDPCGNAVCGLASGGACDDGNPCTQGDSCATGQCVGAPLSGGACGAGRVCEQGACVPGCWLNGTRVDAGAREGCLTCDPVRSVNSWSIAVDAGCDDANACTLFDRCDATGACAGTGVISCPQAPCHEYAACNPASGLCDETAPLPDGMRCDDAHYCLGGVCTHACNIDGGVVPAGGFKPGNPCRRCDPDIDATAWAVLDGVPCDDGDACSSSSVCAAGSCLALDVVTCVALDACHLAGVCDPVSGECSNPVADAGTPCSDGFACTVNDVCADGACAGDGSGCACAKAADCPLPPPCQALSGCVDHQCRYVNDDAASCSDGDGCTTGDHCAAGACVARGEVPCMRDEACVAFTCDASTGACVTHHLDDGTGCDGGACLRGACVPPDAGTPDGGVDGLAPVHFVASGCGTGGSFLLGAIGLFLCLRRRF